MDKFVLFNSGSFTIFDQINHEISFQLFNLQNYCVKLLSITAKQNSVINNEVVSLIKKFLNFGICIYSHKPVKFSYILQFDSQMLRMIFPHLNENERIRFSQLIIIGMIMNKLSPLKCKKSDVLYEIFYGIHSGNPCQSKDFSDFQSIFIEEPFLLDTLMDVISIDLSNQRTLPLSTLEVDDSYSNNIYGTLKILLSIKQYLSYYECDEKGFGRLVSISNSRKHIMRHISIELICKQTPDEKLRLCSYLKNFIIDDLLSSSELITEGLTNTSEKLCYVVVVNDSLPTMAHNFEFWDLGWFILISDSRGLINILLSVINILIEAQSFDQLLVLLKSKCMVLFNQLLLINLWHPNLANVTAMEVLLDTCYPNKRIETQISDMETLCLKIRTRWDTLKKFNAKFCNLTEDQSTNNVDIRALTTMGNTSHLEFIAGLSDPTSYDENALLDLLERTGQNFDNSMFSKKNIHIESEIIEENCDKSIFYCALSIRKVWECLILFSSSYTRQLIFNFLHQNGVLTDTELIDTKELFYTKFRSALQENDLNLLEEVYQKSIINRLEYLKYHLHLINPLSLRLELLENIYSLIFTTEYDLFSFLLSSTNCPSVKKWWQMPETVKLKNGKPKCSPIVIDSLPNLDKNKLICSFFLCKDLLILLKHHVSNLLANKLQLKGLDFDNKMAAYINYPTYDDVETRIDNLFKALNDLQWRMDFLSLNKVDFSHESFGIINETYNFIFDVNIQQCLNVYRPRINQKIRSRSSINSCKVKSQGKNGGYTKDNEEIVDYEEIESYPITNAVKKEKNKSSTLFSPYNLEFSLTTSNDDSVVNITELSKFTNSNKLKVNCQFLMESLSWIIEPVEHLAITALVCGCKEKVNCIVEICRNMKTINPLLTELLTEITYKTTFGNFVEKLALITTPSTTSEEKEKNGKPFGHFDWNKLSALNAKISSYKENEVVEIVNHLLMLNNDDRPSLKMENSDENQNDSPNNSVAKVSDYNSGLLLDLTLYGANTKWQLLQMLLQIQSRQCIGDALIEKKSLENTSYKKLSGIKPFVKQLHDSLVITIDEDNVTYTSLEMKGMVDHQYFIRMQKWLSKFQTFIKLLQFNMNENVDFHFINADVETRWNYLTNLTDFIKATSNSDVEIPFKYLKRNAPQYLESLQSHLKIFVNFLKEQKHSSKISTNNPSPTTQRHLLHEFSVLKRSPSDVLGELIFYKMVDPLGNEIAQISQDLGLNISEVIIQNCLPIIPSYPDETENNLSTNKLIIPLSVKKIHNQFGNLDDKRDYTVNPLEIVTTCLEKIIKLLLKSCKSNSEYNISFGLLERNNHGTVDFSKRTLSISSVGSVDTSRDVLGLNNQEDSQTFKTEEQTILSVIDWKILLSLSEEEDWVNILKIDIISLNFADIDSLKTNNERTAFFINLYNLMFIHMMILAVQNGRSTLKYRSFESGIYRENFCYKIGQIGVLSMHELSQYYLNVLDLTFPDFETNDIVLPFPLEMEQKYANSCPSLQTMCIFGLTDGTVSGPPLKVYKPSSLLEDLQNNLSNILKFKSIGDYDKRQIHLPQIFKWYNKRIPLNNKFKTGGTNNLNTISNRNEDNLFERILSHCSDDISVEYFRLFKMDTDSISYNIKDHSYPKSVKIIWLSRSEVTGFCWVENVQNVSFNTSQLVDSDPNDADFTNENTSTFINHQFNNILSINYRPTCDILEPLRKVSPLLASLVYTIVGDDFLSDTSSLNVNSEFNSTNNERINEVHSYKYYRLQDIFSTFGKWISRYWTPWHFHSNLSLPFDLNISRISDSLLGFCRDNVPLEIRWVAFIYPAAKSLQNVLLDYSLQFINQNALGYFFIGSAIRNLHSIIIDNSYELQHLLDMILVKSAQYWAIGLTDENETNKSLPPDNNLSQDESRKCLETRLLDCLYAIKDCDLRLSESYRYLDLLNIHNAVSLMEINSLCYPKDEKMMEQIKMLRIFRCIHELISFCQSKDEVWFKMHLPTEFLSWKKLQHTSENNPEQVFKFLIQQKKFDLTRKWCQFFMKDNGKERTDAEFIISLVSKGTRKQNLIQLTLHLAELHKELGAEKLLDVINFVINHTETPLAIIVCCAYVIKEVLFSEIHIKSLQWQSRIIRTWVGASMLRSIPNGIIRDLYSHLVEYPDLILEQLIMNSQIDLFRKMIEVCRELKKVYLSTKKMLKSDCSYKMSHEEFIDELEPHRINKLIIEYTFKALELPAVSVEEDNESNDVKLDGRQSIASSKSDLCSLNESSDTLIIKTALSNKVISSGNLRSDESINDFHVPLSSEKWIQDKDASVCMCCKKEIFSMFNRRHHCRRCGRVICAVCSIHRTLIKGVTVRICNDCHKSIQSSFGIDHARRGSILDDKHRTDESPRSSLSVGVSNLESLDQFANIPLEVAVGALENGWRLSVDPEENEIIRQMFYYDDAPSITLAFSLIYFHSNSNECGNKLLDRVEYLADFLKPMKTGLPNSEVDYLLVIDIAKRITYKAKEKLSFVNNDVDFARAEVYLSRLDLLGILVHSNYSHCLPPLGDGSKFREKIRYLRDKLISEERLELARIVSDKAGLSNDPVLVAMGLHALEEGKFDEARKYFASCSKSRPYSSLVGSTLPHPLNEIMKVLDKHGVSVEKIGEIINNIRDTNDLLKNPESKYIKECEISQKQIEEAIYYFDSYDTTSHCLQFLCRQQMWSKAIDYVMKKNVSKDIFINGLIAPSVSSGRFSSVKREMLMRDGGITIWRSYYDVLCVYLEKNRCYDDLLEWQELNNDHFGVARTLIQHFYLSGAQSYADLDKRIHHLINAEKHIKKLIKQSESNINDSGKYEKKLILIQQQIEATKFLSNQITVTHHQSGFGYVAQSNQPPTLFSSQHIIIDFCLMILFSRPNILDGLQMLCPMMSLCHIYPEKILPLAAKWLFDNPTSIFRLESNKETVKIDSVLELCGHICTCYRLDTRKSDDILMSVLSVIPLAELRIYSINNFINLLKSEQKKIDAYIFVKDLKRAFASAVKFKYVDDVRRILEIANHENDTSGVIDLCTQWLAVNNP